MITDIPVGSVLRRNWREAELACFLPSIIRKQKEKAMNKIAKFEKISEKQLYTDADLFLSGVALTDDFGATCELLNYMLEKTPMPKRATTGSAGYDIYSPVSRYVKAGETFTIPTGLRCHIEDGWFLMILPRSGLGFRYGMRLVNTAPVIDADYVHAENEGHIILKFVTNKDFIIKEGDRIAQGIFLPYGVTEDDRAEGERSGGFGSTGV